jgi:hypothetical protein
MGRGRRKLGRCTTVQICFIPKNYNIRNQSYKMYSNAWRHASRAAGKNQTGEIKKADLPAMLNS